MVEKTPLTLDRDQRIGRGAAIGFLTTVGAGLIVGPLMTSANLIIALVSGRTPNMEQASGVTTMMKWRDNLPIDIPWWVFLAVSLALVVLLVLVWSPARHYFEFWRRKVILVASPLSLALGGLVWAFMSFGFGSYYQARDAWPGFVLLPALVALAVTVVGLVHQWRLSTKPARRRRRPLARDTDV